VDFLVRANLLSTIHLLRAIVPVMKTRGFGRIVLVGAKATLSPGAGMGVYLATKAGINQLVQSVAEELKPADITINAVMPSMIDTPANRKAMPEADYGKWVAREELAGIIFGLTQPGSRAIHGALIPVSGRL
jgi:NAD(P)-dependent dehydrogenase (short-subunit alcohol dehydrogenase family)